MRIIARDLWNVKTVRVRSAGIFTGDDNGLPLFLQKSDSLGILIDVKRIYLVRAKTAEGIWKDAKMYCYTSGAEKFLFGRPDGGYVMLGRDEGIYVSQKNFGGFVEFKRGVEPTKYLTFQEMWKQSDEPDTECWKPTKRIINIDEEVILDFLSYFLSGEMVDSIKSALGGKDD